MNGTQIGKLIGTAAQVAPTAARLEKATQDLEAIFIKDLLGAMRKTVSRNPIGSTMGGEVYQDLFDQAIAESASRTGTLGFGKTIYAQMAPAALRTALAKALLEVPDSHDTSTRRGTDVLATDQKP
jgi:flagellar protein FlgJ